HYLQNRWITRLLGMVSNSVFKKRPWIYGITTIVVLIAMAGIYNLRSVGYIVDDLPEDNKVYTDLKFFEKHFTGVMPLEIVVDTRRKNAATSLTMMQKI